MINMKSIWCRYRFFLVILTACLLAVFVLREVREKRMYVHSHVRSFTQEFTRKERSLEVIMDSLTAVLSRYPEKTPDLLWDEIPSSRFEEEGLGAFIWHKDSLLFWSHNTIPVPEIWQENFFGVPFLHLKTVWVVPLIRNIGEYHMVGMILVKWVYPYENDLLENFFHPSFNIPNSVKISTQALPDSYPVQDRKGETLFYLLFDESVKSELVDVIIPSLLYLTVFLLLLFYPICWLKNKTDSYRRRGVIALILLGLGGRIAMQVFRFPDVWYQLEWFDPVYLAIPFLFPSLGDLLVTMGVVSVLTMYYFLYYRFSEPVTYRYTRGVYRFQFGFVFWLLFIIFLHILSLDMIEKIILNSEISVDGGNVLLFTSLSLGVYFAIALLFVVFVLLYEKWIEYIRPDFSLKTFYALIVSISLVSLLYCFFSHESDVLMAVLLFPLISWLIARVGYRPQREFRYIELVLLALLFAMYTTGLVYYYGEMRSRQERSILAMNLSSERDDVAEYLLSELDPRLRQDSMLKSLVMRPDFSMEELSAYLSRQYFYGYWEKYSLQSVVCTPEDPLALEPPVPQPLPCYSFFHNIIVQRGVPLLNSEFYFIQDRNGPMTYLGRIPFRQSGKEVSIFLELTSKYNTYEIGYPELLIERKISGSLLNEYSYARYHKNVLIDNYGEYPYHRIARIYGEIPFVGSFKHMDDNGYHHTLYNAGDETLFVLSSPVASRWTIVFTFSYVFLLFVMLVSVLFIAGHRKFLYELLALNFQNKIQYSVLTLMILFIMIITSVSASFLLQQSQRKHTDIITQKLQSIAVEFNNSVGLGEWDFQSQEQMESFLFEQARVYFTDINLYFPDGTLLASSRPEVFSKGLLGTQISPKVFQRLHFQGEMLIIGEEQIGSLKYISAYIPLTNSNNQVKGILNVPYFMQQNVLTQEVSSLLITVLNLFVLLFLLSLILSVFISRQLTHPLRILQQYLGRIQLSTQAELLEYSGKDEIGDLVKAYNQMVEELARNVDQLAKSERESAWREMAKQIAHEIKNPLTPMKLNVQHIQRAKEQKSGHFDQMFERVTAHLIEQIDLLSEIASQFSNFASMSVMHMERVNVVGRLDQVVQLFIHAKAKFVLLYDPSEVIWVWGDGRRITQVFTNLVKNALQAVPQDRLPVITLKVVRHGKQVWIKISDNGSGIPDEMMDKIFEPNFTTKSSGMGLGLAIVKSIVETLQGEISYTTEEGVGSSFLVRFPVIYEQDNTPEFRD